MSFPQLTTVSTSLFQKSFSETLYYFLSFKGKVLSPVILSSRHWGQSLHRKQTWSEVYPRVFQQTANVVKQKGKYIPFNWHVVIIRIETIECTFLLLFFFFVIKVFCHSWNTLLIVPFRNQFHHVTSTTTCKWLF